MLKRIAPDKWKHFFVGIVMGIFLECFFLYLLGLSLTIGTLFSMAIAIAISYGFELFSLFTGRGHYDILDAVASIIGAGIGVGAIAFLN
jgi:hypothetical protein